MNIEIFGDHFAFGIVVTIFLIIATNILYRIYKRVGRRCRKTGCGSLRVKRVHRIHLGKDESISIFSVDKKLRWWIRRVLKETFAICPDCGHIELVKTSEDPISWLHALKVNIFDPNQYRDDPKLNTVAYLAGKSRLDRRHLEKGPNSILEDTPPIKGIDLIIADFK